MKFSTENYENNVFLGFSIKRVFLFETLLSISIYCKYLNLF